MDVPARKPHKLNFRIEGWYSRTICWLPDDDLVGMGSGGFEKFRRPDAEAWEGFWTKVEDLDAWCWKESYGDDIEIADLERWSLEIVLGDRSLESRGTIMNTPPSWKEFLVALANLSQDDSLSVWTNSGGNEIGT